MFAKPIQGAVLSKPGCVAGAILAKSGIDLAQGTCEASRCVRRHSGWRTVDLSERSALNLVQVRHLTDKADGLTLRLQSLITRFGRFLPGIGLRRREQTSPSTRSPSGWKRPKPAAWHGSGSTGFPAWKDLCGLLTRSDIRRSCSLLEHASFACVQRSCRDAWSAGRVGVPALNLAIGPAGFRESLDQPIGMEVCRVNALEDDHSTLREPLS